MGIVGARLGQKMLWWAVGRLGWCKSVVYYTYELGASLWKMRAHCFLYLGCPWKTGLPWKTGFFMGSLISFYRLAPYGVERYCDAAVCPTRFPFTMPATFTWVFLIFTFDNQRFFDSVYYFNENSYFLFISYLMDSTVYKCNM